MFKQIFQKKKSENSKFVGTASGQWGDLFTQLAEAVAGAPPVRPKPLDQDGLLNLFDSKDTGGDFVLVADDLFQRLNQGGEFFQVSVDRSDLE